MSDDAILRTKELIDVLDAGPTYMEGFDAEIFEELVDRIIVESNDRIHFRLRNGLVIPETIERTVR